MVRTQVSLTQEQHQFLASLARQTGVSLSTLVRQAVDLLRRDETTPDKQLLGLLGAFEADRSDVSVHHDAYFSASVAGRGRRPAR